MNKTKDMLPDTPFEIYRYLDDNTLVRGVVKKIYFFEADNILVGIPTIEYDESSCSRPLTPSERCSAPYAEALCLTPEEAKNGRLKNLKMMLEIYEENKTSCVENFLRIYEDRIQQIQKTRLQILELEQNGKSV